MDRRHYVVQGEFEKGNEILGSRTGCPVVAAKQGVLARGVSYCVVLTGRWRCTCLLK